MKNALYLLTICLTLLLSGCSEDNSPTPDCQQVEVIGEDCNTGWYILRLKNSNPGNAGSNRYLGQLQDGFVTTDNLPAAYQHPGLTLAASLELNGEYGPRCVTVAVMYPAVRVKRICSGEPAL